MSVRSNADDCLDEAKEHVRGAIAALNQIVVPQVHGHDDWNEGYRVIMRDTYATLIKLRDELEK